MNFVQFLIESDEFEKMPFTTELKRDHVSWLLKQHRKQERRMYEIIEQMEQLGAKFLGGFAKDSLSADEAHAKGLEVHFIKPISTFAIMQPENRGKIHTLAQSYNRCYDLDRKAVEMFNDLHRKGAWARMKKKK